MKLRAGKRKTATCEGWQCQWLAGFIEALVYFEIESLVLDRVQVTGFEG